MYVQLKQRSNTIHANGMFKKGLFSHKVCWRGIKLILIYLYIYIDRFLSPLVRCVYTCCTCLKLYNER